MNHVFRASMNVIARGVWAWGLLYGCVAAAQLENAEDPQLFIKGAETPRAEGFPSLGAKNPEVGGGTVEKTMMSLNGAWKFFYADKRSELPEGFETVDFADSAWRDIQVPGSWQTEGVGAPYFLKNALPFAAQAPQIRLMQKNGQLAPAGSPVGLYRTRFQLPPDWAKQRVLVHVGAFDSSMQLWLNGKALGYAEDSRMGAEFDVTAALSPGENVLAVAVTQFCDGSYLESQPVVRLAGLQRDVTLWCAPQQRVSDYWVQTPFDPQTGNGRLSVAVTLKNTATLAGSGRWSIVLRDEQGVLAEFRSAEVKIDPQSELTQTQELEIARVVRPWSAEQPQLYDYVLQWRNESGEVQQELKGKTGFRRSRWVNDRWELNDHAVEVRGVVRFDVNPRRGRTMSADDMRQELLQMKRANINAIRTGFAPPDPTLLALCDELGFYVFAEPNIQLPMTGASAILSDPRWQDALVQRVKAVVERDKNHVSVVSWVLPDWGKQDGCFRSLLSGTIQRDTSRAWSRLDAPRGLMVNATTSQTTSGGLRAIWGDQMGNGGANLVEKWRSLAAEGLQGGFFGYWRDQSIVQSRHASKAVEDVSPLKQSCRLLGRVDATQGLHRGAAVVEVSDAVKLIAPCRFEAECLLDVDHLQRAVLWSDDEEKLELSAEKTLNDKVTFLFRQGQGAAQLHVKGEVPITELRSPVRLGLQWLADRLRLSLNDRVIAETMFSSVTDAVGEKQSNGSRRWILNGDRRLTSDAIAVAMRSVKLWSSDTKESVAPQNVLLDLRFAEAASKPSTTKSLDYGGDFGELPHEGAVLSHGLVNPSGAPNPMFEELKKAYQPLSFQLRSHQDGLKLALKNHQAFVPGQAWKGSWKLLKDGLVVDQGDCASLSLAPMVEQELVIRPNVGVDGQGEYLLRVRYDLTEATAWNPVGMPVAWEEILLPGGKRPESVWQPEGATAPELHEMGDQVQVLAGDVKYAVSRASGMLFSMQKMNQEWLKSPLALQFTRPLTAMERTASASADQQFWRDIEDSGQVSALRVVRGSRDVALECDITYAAGVKVRLIYRFDAAGRVRIETAFDPGTVTNMPLRLGYHCHLDDGATLWQWLGKGPHENYRGRSQGAWTAGHEGLVGSLFHRYMLPQESGNRSAVRWTQLCNGTTGGKWRVDADASLLNVKALPCNERDMNLARHGMELLSINEIHVYLDHWTSANSATGDSFRAAPQQWSMLLSMAQGQPAPKRPAMSLPPGIPMKPGQAVQPPSAPRVPHAPRPNPSTKPVPKPSDAKSDAVKPN